MTLIELVEFLNNKDEWTGTKDNSYKIVNNKSETVAVGLNGLAFRKVKSDCMILMPKGSRMDYQIDEANGLIIIDELCAVKYA